jgi:hypothetical protein
MARLDRAAIAQSLSEHLKAVPDPDGRADLVADQGLINVAAGSAEIDAAIGKLKSIDGYRWIAINAGDLFVASPKSIGTKVGILDPAGKVLKAADLKRPRP